MRDLAAAPGRWWLVRGQRFPEPLGWWSPGQLTIGPITTASYELQTADIAHHDTIIEVRAAPATSTR